MSIIRTLDIKHLILLSCLLVSVLGMTSGLSLVYANERGIFNRGSIIPRDTTSRAVPDSLHNELPGQAPHIKEVQKLEVVKREYDFRQQVGLALGMMAFLTFIMGVSQSWNPD